MASPIVHIDSGASASVSSRQVPPSLSSGDVARRANGLSPWQIRRVSTHIEEHLTAPLRVVDLAALVKLSSSHFGRGFGISFNQSPHAYVVARRIARAKRLMLANATRPLSKIA